MAAGESHSEVKMGSDRSFGLVFAAVFLIAGLWPLTDESGQIRVWALGIAAGFALISVVAPKVLNPLNRVWFWFGLLLGKIVTPVVMALLFFLTVTPIGMIMRMLGKDLLRKKIEKSASSYWIERKNPVGTMKNQF